MKLQLYNDVLLGENLLCAMILPRKIDIDIFFQCHYYKAVMLSQNYI